MLAALWRWGLSPQPDSRAASMAICSNPTGELEVMACQLSSCGSVLGPSDCSTGIRPRGQGQSALESRRSMGPNLQARQSGNATNTLGLSACTPSVTVHVLACAHSTLAVCAGSGATLPLVRLQEDEDSTRGGRGRRARASPSQSISALLWHQHALLLMPQCCAAASSVRCLVWV